MINPIPSTIPANWRDNVFQRQINIYVGENETLIPQEYLLLNSIEITEKACDGKFHLGGVIASRLTFTVNTDCITFGDDILTVKEHIVLNDNSEYDFFLGAFQVDRTDSVVTATENYFEGKYVAYDYIMLQLDKEITADDVSGWSQESEKTLANLYHFVMNKVGDYTTDPTDYSYILASPNNTAKPNYENGASEGYLLNKALEQRATYRDIISCIAALVGGAFIQRRSMTYNHYPMRLIQFHVQQPMATISAADRISSQIDNQPGRPLIDEITFGDISGNYPYDEDYPANTLLNLSIGDNLLLPLPEEYNNPEYQGPVIQDMLYAVNSHINNWTGTKTSPQKQGEPLVLTTANITYFGDPTIEAGDYVTLSFSDGSPVNAFVMEHIYRFRQPSVIRSYGEASSTIYSSYSPSYGEARRPTAYDAAAAKQIAALNSRASAAENKVLALEAAAAQAEEDIAGCEERIETLEHQIAHSDYYSTAEHIVGRWIDNSYLYERTYVIADASAGAEADLDIDWLVEIVESRGQLISGTDSRPFDGFRCDDEALTVDAAEGKAYITLRYTRLEEEPPVIYGWHVDPSISDPAQAVTYLADAIGKTPAAMGASTFSYGDWENAFFMPKPCMLRSDGTVAYYLDPNDYTKKADGTPSDVANASFDGNAMMEWPLIWYKFEAGTAEGEGYFYCSNKQVDSSYKCWCNYDANNNIINHFYTAIYDVTGTDKARSLSGIAITSANGNGETSGVTEIQRATANNTTEAVEWYIGVYSDRILISALLILISKTLNDQVAFGNGLVYGAREAKEAYVSGTLNSKGLFWGDKQQQTSAVKIFGMENWYGCSWKRTAGLIGTSTGWAYKLTYGTVDGSNAIGYNSDGTGYQILSGRPTVNAPIKTMRFGDHGLIPLSGYQEMPKNDKYWPIYIYGSNVIPNGYAIYGGNTGTGEASGSLCLGIGNELSYSRFSYSGSLSCKPVKT